jgi:Fe2+ or Zn2+ uptake regulation protein
MREKDATNNYKVLSIAAKMDNILESEKKPMYVEEILEEAQILGWKISMAEAQSALELLKKLEMVDDA